MRSATVIARSGGPAGAEPRRPRALPVRSSERRISTRLVADAESWRQSNDGQIRDTVLAFRDDFNTQNWDAYLNLMCRAIGSSSPVL